MPEQSKTLYVQMLPPPEPEEKEADEDEIEMKIKMKNVYVVDGRWYRVDFDGYDTCCDCGLRHRVEYKIRDGKIYWRSWRDNHFKKALKLRIK